MNMRCLVILGNFIADHLTFSGQPFLSPSDFVEHYDNLRQSQDSSSMNCQCILCLKKTSVLSQLSESLASAIEKTFPQQPLPDLKSVLNRCLSNFVTSESVQIVSETTKVSPKPAQKESSQPKLTVRPMDQDMESLDNPSPVDTPKILTSVTSSFSDKNRPPNSPIDTPKVLSATSSFSDKKRPPEKIPFSSDFGEDDLVWIPVICESIETKQFLHLTHERRLPIAKILNQTILWPAIIEKVFQSSEHLNQIPVAPLLLSSVGKKVLLKAAQCVNNYVVPANTYVYQVRLICLEKVLPFYLPEECIIPHAEASIPKVWLSIKAHDIALLRYATSDVLIQCYFEALVRMSHRASFRQVHIFPKDVGFTLGCETFRIGDLLRVRVQMKGKETSQAILRLASFQSQTSGPVKCYGRHVNLNPESRTENATVFIPKDSMKTPFPDHLLIHAGGDQLVPCSLREVSPTFYEFLEDRILGRFYRRYPTLIYNDSVGFNHIIN
jgi:hypothetical protein